MWHASIARQSNAGPVATQRWGDGTIREAKLRVLAALDGVGKDPTVASLRKIALHIRRSLTDAEMERLTCEWLAIPAQDEFSEDGEMEMTL